MDSDEEEMASLRASNKYAGSIRRTPQAAASAEPGVENGAGAQRRAQEPEQEEEDSDDEPSGMYMADIGQAGPGEFRGLCPVSFGKQAPVKKSGVEVHEANRRKAQAPNGKGGVHFGPRSAVATSDRKTGKNAEKKSSQLDEGMAVDSGQEVQAELPQPGRLPGLGAVIEEGSDGEGYHGALPISHEAVIPAHEKPVTAMALDPKATRMVTGGMDGTVKFFDFGGMSAEKSAFRSLEPVEGHMVQATSFGSSGGRVLVICSDSHARIYDRDGTSKPIQTTVKGDMYVRDMSHTKGHTQMLTDGLWHPFRPEHWLTSSLDGTLRLWDLNATPVGMDQVLPSVHVLKTLDKRNVCVGGGAGRAGGLHPRCCTFSPTDAKMMVGGCSDGSVQVFFEKARYQRPDKILRTAHSGPVSGVSFVCEGNQSNLLVTRGLDDVVKVWDCRKLSDEKGPVASKAGLHVGHEKAGVCASPTGQHVVVGTSYDKASGRNACVQILSAKDLSLERSIDLGRTDMKAKGEKLKEVESMTYASYSKFVRLRTQELNHDITTAKAEIEELTADISKHESDMTSMGHQIGEIDAEVSTMDADLKASTKMRQSEHAEFLEEQTSYTESLYALDQAIQLLQAQNFDRDQVKMLLQRTTKTAPYALRALRLLQTTSEAERDAAGLSGAPAVAAYEFQSSGVLNMLKELRKKFKGELAQLQKEEMNMAHAHSMQELHATNTMSNLKSEKESLTEAKLRIASENAGAKEELANSKSSLAESQQLLSDLTAAYSAKKVIFEGNQKVRTEELEVIAKAIEILSSPEVVSGYAKHVKSLIQQGSGLATTARAPAISFLQQNSAGRAAARDRAAAFLHDHADLLRSEVLSSIVQQMKENPFAKVIDMIKSLLARLKQEATSEAEHKAFCDEELRTNKLKRDKLNSRVASLHAEIDAKTITIAKMANTLAVLAQEQAELRAAMANSTAQRQEERAVNKQAIEDAKGGQAALNKAIAVIQEFYAQQGALVQVSAGKQVPEVEEYKGMIGSKKGVIGMLEVIKSDFARVEADTKASEDQAARDYKAFMSESEEALEVKHDAEFKLGLKKDQEEFERGQLQKDLASTQEQLKMSNDYYEQLKPQCVTIHVSYEERAGKRQEEIKALQEAYRILNGESTAE